MSRSRTAAAAALVAVGLVTPYASAAAPPDPLLELPLPQITLLGVGVPGLGANAKAAAKSRPTYTGPDGWSCWDNWHEPSGTYVVTCNPEGGGTRRCQYLTVDVDADGPSGRLSGTSMCTQTAVTAEVTSPGHGSNEGAADEDTPWYCMAVEEGNPRPWRVTCGLTSS